MGATGGIDSVPLTVAQCGLPAHNHGVTDVGHVHVLRYNSTSSNRNTTGGNTASSINQAGNTKGVTSSSTGISINTNTAANAASAHLNLQPVIFTNFIIKYM